MAERLKVRLLGADGEAMGEEALKSLYASDLHFEPIRRQSEIGPDGTVEIQIPDGPTALHARICAPGFGTLWMTADNGGEGYGKGEAVLDFVRDAAAGRLGEVQRFMAGADVDWSASCRAHVDAASEQLESAGLASGANAAALRLLALSHGMWAGELAVVEQSRARIAGRPRRDDFLVGCNTFTRGEHVEAIRRRFSELLNFGTLPFYLKRLEPEEGKPDYGWVDEILAWCEREAITPKGHPLWWGHPAGIPPWLEGADWETAQRHCRRVVGRSVERYRGRIQIWDAINEAHDWANGLNLTQEQEVAITGIACDSIREKDPDAVIVVNSCQPCGEYSAEGTVLAGPIYEQVFTPLAYMDAVMEAGVDFDVVGVQMYFPSNIGRDMMTIGKFLDEYARFGKPVHVTELGVSSDGRTAGLSEEKRDLMLAHGDWHQPWCEKVQADWMEWFYTMCYARPEVEALTWWSIADPAFIPRGGFVREDATPKESYHRLGALLRGWGIAR